MKYTVTLDSVDINTILAVLSGEANRRRVTMELTKDTCTGDLAKQQYEEVKTAYNNLKLEREFAIRREGMTCEVKSLAES